MAYDLELMHGAVVGGDAVAFMSRFEGFDEDHVVVGVICQHDVVVDAARADGEAANVVSVELADGLNDNEQFFGALGRELTGDAGEGDLGGRLGFGGAGTLS